MKLVDLLFGMFVCGIAIATQGCSGIEVGTKAWVMRVDESQSSQRTHREAVPWKCYFVNCGASEEVQGS